MVKQFSIRLTEEIEKFVDSWAIGDVTRTDVINILLQKAREDMEIGKESRTEARMIVETPNLRKALMVDGYCGECASLAEPEAIKKIPCIRDANFDFFHWKDCQECALFSKEIRELLVQEFC
jgi:hypothetical protein